MSWLWTWYWFHQIRTWLTDWRGCLRGGLPLWRWRMDPSHWSALFTWINWMQTKIMAIHRSSGHPGVRRTTYFVRKICPTTPRAAVKIAIKTCEECQSIDPAPVHWEKGTLEVDDNLQRMGMDITHYGAHHFLTLTDCGPSRFSIWRQVARKDSANVIRQLETVFFF